MPDSFISSWVKGHPGIYLQHLPFNDNNCPSIFNEAFDFLTRENPVPPRSGRIHRGRGSFWTDEGLSQIDQDMYCVDSIEASLFIYTALVVVGNRGSEPMDCRQGVPKNVEA